jgi:hypothetical protein
MNWVFISTHGLASGIAITSFYNSCINIMYTAYGFHLCAHSVGIKANLQLYLQSTMFYTYGDDLIGSVKDSVKLWFNPATYRQVIKSLHLDFTPADKGEWTDDNMFGPIEKHSFLKRDFRFHPRLQTTVAPLSTVSMNSTLNYISDGMRNEELCLVKLANYQREAYLHYETYSENMAYVKNFANEKGLYPTFYTERQLIELYKNNEYAELLVLH